jgi:hypothetical protein
LQPRRQVSWSLLQGKIEDQKNREGDEIDAQISGARILRKDLVKTMMKKNLFSIIQKVCVGILNRRFKKRRSAMTGGLRLAWALFRVVGGQISVAER